MRSVPHLLVLIQLFAVGPKLSAQTPQQPTPPSVEAATSDFRARIVTSMREAAQKAGVPINADKTVIGTRHDILVANAPVTGNKDTVMFTYFSFAGTPCEQTLASGFYKVLAVTDPKTKKLQAHFVNSEGKTALVRPMEIGERKATPAEKGQMEAGVTLRSMGMIFVGVCTCQWAPSPSNPYRWRHLHSVVV